MSSDSLDDIDYAIINILKNDSRLSIREISKMINRSPSTISERIRKLENRGVIKRYTITIDHGRLGYKLNAITLLQVDGAHIEDVEKMLMTEPNVRAVYDITGEYDVAIITTFRDSEELDRFIKKMLKNPYIKRSVTNIILRIVKESPTLDKNYGEK
ncbi:MAG: winged helix-turn-helix transcriptional regulator [Desulfurococcales archaeon]|nr:winged helix-turn-helix transcriptional regulator [Desulfurococcales archaeon]